MRRADQLLSGSAVTTDNKAFDKGGHSGRPEWTTQWTLGMCAQKVPRICEVLLVWSRIRRYDIAESVFNHRQLMQAKCRCSQMLLFVPAWGSLCEMLRNLS